MRVFITAAPRMYREALALAIRQRRPTFEVMIGPPESLDGEANGFRPHMLVGNDTDGGVPKGLEDVVCRIEILFSDDLDARVTLGGRVRHVKDISVEELISFADETETTIGGR